MGSHLWLPWERDGRSVAYAEGNGFGELIDGADKVADCLRALPGRGRRETGGRDGVPVTARA